MNADYDSIMSRAAPNRLIVEPGPDSVRALTKALEETLQDDGPALALVPGPASASARRTAALEAAVRTDSPMEADDIALIVPTSGSSGESRGVMLSRTAVRSAVRGATEVLGPGGLWLTALPVTGIGGLLTVLRTVQVGHQPVIWPGVGGAQPFTAESFVEAALDCQRKAQGHGRPAYLSLVPTQLARLDTPEALAALAGFRAVLVGGSALPTWARQRAQDAGARIIETYGATETCGGVIYDGQPLPGVELQICEPDESGRGQIRVGGPTIATGYRLRPDLTERRFRDGWFCAPDRGHLENGQLVIDDRTDQTIKVGGHKVSLSAIANVVRGHPRVIDAVAIAEPDDEWGLVPVCYVIGDESAITSSDFDHEHLAERLTFAVRDRLGRASSPRRIEFVYDLPVGPTGKTIPNPSD